MSVLYMRVHSSPFPFFLVSFSFFLLYMLQWSVHELAMPPGIFHCSSGKAMIHVSPSNPICTVVYPRRELPHSHRHIIYKPRTYGYQGFSAIMALQPSRHESYYGFTVNLQSVWFYNQYGLTAITVLLSTWSYYH